VLLSEDISAGDQPRTQDWTSEKIKPNGHRDIRKQEIKHLHEEPWKDCIAQHNTQELKYKQMGNQQEAKSISQICGVYFQLKYIRSLHITSGLKNGQNMIIVPLHPTVY
jgi:hypothetical protein